MRTAMVALALWAGVARAQDGRWTLLLTGGDGSTYRSEIGMISFDCGSWRLSTYQFTMYDSKGTAVFTSQPQASPSVMPPPGSLGDRVVKAVCTHAPQQHLKQGPSVPNQQDSASRGSPRTPGGMQ